MPGYAIVQKQQQANMQPEKRMARDRETRARRRRKRPVCAEVVCRVTVRAIGKSGTLGVCTVTVVGPILIGAHYVARRGADIVITYTVR